MLLGLLDQPDLLVIVPLALIIVISLHEFSHALMAYWLGDHTAEYEGRLTLNPLVHLDPTGTILLLLVGFGWGKPVPFNPYNLKFRRWGSAFVAGAGPISNFFWAIIFTIVMRLSLTVFDQGSLAVQFLFYVIIFNVILGIFNLLPIPPLDGSKILLTILPARYDRLGIWLQQNGSILLIGLLIVMYMSEDNFFGEIIDFFLNLLFSTLLA